MPEAPRQRPLRHRHPRRDLALGDLLDLAQLSIDRGAVPAGADIALRKLVARLVLAGQEPAGQRDARQHAQVLPLTRVEYTLLGRRPIEPVVDDLDRLDLLRRRSVDL